MARRREGSEAQVELFLDMLAAERGAGKNTLDAYSRDLADLSDYLRGAELLAAFKQLIESPVLMMV